VFPDATKALCTLFNQELTPPCVPRVPNPRPSIFLVVRRVGGPRRNLVTDEPMVAVEAWADSDENAHDLIQQARAVLHAAIGTAGIYRVTEISGPGNLPDPVSDQPRYTQTFQVALRGTP
jgi:hypothetical protein